MGFLFFEVLFESWVPGRVGETYTRAVFAGHGGRRIRDPRRSDVRDCGVLTDLPLIEDPWFYLTATLAVLILGIAKGGFAGGIGLVAVPLMSLTIEPARAAAILLPILILITTPSVEASRVSWEI